MPKAMQNAAIAAGYTGVDPATVVATHPNNSIVGSAAELFGIDDAQALIENLKTHYPQLAQNLSPQGYALPRVASLCKSFSSSPCRCAIFARSPRRCSRCRPSSSARDRKSVV